MAVNLEQLKVFFPEQLCLGFGEQEREQAEAMAAQFSDPAESDRAFLNSLCLQVMTPSIEDIFELKSGALKSVEISAKHTEIWQSLNGVAINLPQGRLVLIPTDELDTEEFGVQQAWLDQPNLAGDIYLAVQVSPEEGWLRVWGFTSQQNLKRLGVYTFNYGGYRIDRSDLWVSLESLPAIWDLIKPKVHVLSKLDFSAIWQPFKELIATCNLQPAIEIRQNRFQHHWGRKIDELISLNAHPLTLTIGFQEETPQQYAVQIFVSSGNEQIYLPEDIELVLLADGEVIDQAKSRKADNWIQVAFKGRVKEEFQVKIQRAEAQIIETFTI
ncbi:MAG: DUF1822 family protein [Coleofasciculaceae cyanobacterium SM2_1_6]|nr:DUF1822 family protein [Coleofasciculaceae cyanobacterium SM2_1_6]